MFASCILLLAPLALVAAEPPDFTFDAPPGPQFSEAEKQTQRDKGTGVVPLVRKAFEAGAESVTIPPGDYRFGKERWGRDGVIYPLEFSDLLRDDDHPFTIDATGATFWFDLPDDQAPSCHFCVGFKDCRNIIFKGATIDRATRGHVEGRITQFDFANNRIELQLSPGITVPATFNDKLEQRVVPFKADGTFCAAVCAASRRRPPQVPTDLPATAEGRSWVTMADTKLLDTIRDTGLLRVGDGLSCIYTVTSSLELVRSAKLTMDGIRVYAAKAWGAEYGGYGAHVWRNCYFGPRPGTSQWQGGEGFMFNATRHGTTLDGVAIRHTTDDIANFHGYWGHIESLADNRVTFKGSGEFDRTVLRDAAPGDRLLFRDRNTGQPWEGGDGLSCVYTVTSSLELVRCAKLTMDGIRVYAAKAWGDEYGGYEAHVWRNCYFGPRPGTSQWQGGEGFMFNATRHGTTLDGVVIRHTTDDIANFHGYWGHIESLAGNRVTFKGSGEFDRTVLRDAAAGDRLLFRDRNTGQPLGEARVVDTEGHVVVADRPLAAFANAIVEWPDHRAPAGGCCGATSRTITSGC